MSFPINVNIPAATNDPADDQPIIMSNFANISGFLSVDHVAPGTASTAGIHKQVHFINETAPGQIGAGGVEFANLQGGQSWPFWQNALGTFQMLGANTATAAGTAFLPGGIILKWGSVTGLSGAWPTSPQTVTFVPVFPNNCFIVNTTFIGPASSSTGDISINSESPGSFVWQFSGSSSASFGGFYWFAVGN